MPPNVREPHPQVADKNAASRRTDALDGLRGVAIVSVILYHSRISWVHGATTSISIFFPLSGYLITRNLLREVESTRRLDFPRFWTRRVRRLMPAAIIGVAFATVVGIWRGFHPRAIEVVAALTGWKNWHYLADGQLGDVLVVWWSLAIEEQYYLVYPFLLLGLLTLGGRRVATVGLGVIAAASLLVVFAWNERGTDTAIQVYYGTHGRLWELLAGCLFALYGRQLPRWCRVPPFASFALMLACQSNLLVRHELWWSAPTRTVITIVATIWLIDGIVHAGPSRTTAFLGGFPLQPIGMISYEMYMVHTTVLIMLPHLGGIRLFTVSGAFLLTVVLSHGVHLVAARFKAR